MMKRILAALLSLMLLLTCALAEEASVSAVEMPAVVEEPADALEQLVRVAAQYLMQQNYTLDILTDYESQTIRVGSGDGETIQVEVDADGEPMGKILIDGEKATVSSEYGEEIYAYDELLGSLMPGMETEGMFDERDLAFLETLGQQAYYELMNAGVIPSVKQMDGNMHFTLSLTPDLIEAAAIRLVERVLEHEAEIDSLLVRLDPLLRSLIPDMYEEYDSETGTTVQREAYTYEELRTIFESWMTDEWLSGWINFEGAHLDVSGFVGGDGWHVDASLFVPGDEGSIWFELDGDEDGGFAGALEYCAEGYSHAAERYEMQALRYNISGKIMSRGISLRVRPEIPVSGFTGLRIDCIWDYSGLVIDAATDVLDLRIALSDYLLDASFVTEELMLDLHLSWFGGVPQGSLICRNDGDGVYFKLNEAE